MSHSYSSELLASLLEKAQDDHDESRYLQEFRNFYGRTSNSGLSRSEKQLYTRFLERYAVMDKLYEPPLSDRQKALREQQGRLKELENKAPIPANSVDIRSLFSQPFERYALEFGMGDGLFSFSQAHQRGDTAFLGFDVFVNGLVKLAKRLDKEPVANLKVAVGDGRKMLLALQEAQLDEVYVLFPDPWPKKRHWRRRLINPLVLDLFARLLKPGGSLWIASDHRDYQVWILEQFQQRHDFTFCASAPHEWLLKPEGWPLTHYARKAMNEGREGHYYCWRRQPY